MAYLQDNDESGSVMLEFAIVSLGLFIGTLIFADTARLIHQYLILSQTAAEGARLLARAPGLEEGIFSDTDRNAAVLGACTANPNATGQPCVHLDMQRRLRFVVETIPKDIDPLATEIRSAFEVAPAGGLSQSVYVELRSELNGFIIPDMPILASHAGPYLVR